MNQSHKAALIETLDALATVDPDIAQAIDQLGYPEPRVRPTGFETFLSTIVSQQISTAAAGSIMGKVRALLPDITAASVLELPEGALRAAGLSHRKVEYATGLAQAVVDGSFARMNWKQWTTTAPLKPLLNYAVSAVGVQKFI